MVLAPYTPHGYSINMHNATRKAVQSRLRRIEGQVGGLLRMVEEDRYCVDVLTQINAVRAAPHKVEQEILRDHVAHCIARVRTHLSQKMTVAARVMAPMKMSAHRS